MLDVKTPLTAREIEAQRILAYRIKDRMLDVTQVYLERQPTNPGLLISGGVDSMVLLQILLELGVRPHCFSFTIKGVPPGSDLKRAAKICEVEGLRFDTMEVEVDADTMVKGLCQVSQDHPSMNNRPSIEVVWIFTQMMNFARSFGIDLLFSGICEGNYHLMSRKYEIRGRKGAISQPGAWSIRWNTLMDQQLEPYMIEGWKRGMMFAAVPNLAYADSQLAQATFRMANMPRKKSITTLPWDEGFKKRYGFLPQVYPLQNGGSGLRDYMEEKILASPYARNLVTNLSTSMVFYNHLRSEAGQRKAPKASVSTWNGWNRSIFGAEHPVDPDNWVDPFIQTGADPTSGLEDLLQLDEEPKDCWGTPQDHEEFANCERARQGLCPIKPHDAPGGSRIDPSECGYFQEDLDVYKEFVEELVRDTLMEMDPAVSAAYLENANRLYVPNFPLDQGGL